MRSLASHRPRVRRDGDQSRATARAVAGLDEVLDVYAMHRAANQTGDEVARRLDELDVRLRTAMPEVGEVFIDATAHRRRSRV
jgi:hypothetical protein